MQGVRDYEPRVVHQLMDLMYRYTADILQDADVRPILGSSLPSLPLALILHGCLTIGQCQLLWVTL